MAIKLRFLRYVSAVILSLCLSLPAEAASHFRADEAYEIGMEAYIYLYPLVLMDVSRRNHINYEVGQKQGLGPMNMFHNMRTYQAVEDRDVVRPNFDTLYSRVWVDLTDGPVIVSVPNTEGRYYLMPTGQRHVRGAVLRLWRGADEAPSTAHH